MKYKKTFMSVAFLPLGLGSLQVRESDNGSGIEATGPGITTCK